MASPLFLSYRWRNGEPPDEVVLLDRELRLRGVPMWRDVRDLFAGGENESEAREGLRHQCCGCVLYFTEEVLESWFITSVELDEVRRRLQRDPNFFVAAVFDGVGETECEALRELTGVNAGDFQGLIISAEGNRDEQLRGFSRDLLRRYLAATGANPPRVRADSWNEVGWQEPELLHLNWSGHDGGSGHLPADWLLLKSAVVDLRTALGESGNRHLELAGNLHLSAAFLLGWEFREPTGWTISCDHPRAPHSTSMPAPDPQGFSLVSRPSQNDSELLLVCVCASADCTRAVLSHRGDEPAPRVQLTVLPPGGKPGRESLDGIDLSALAVAVVAAARLSREQHGVALTHLYLACPWTLAVALGWSFSSSGPLVVHEANADKNGYHLDPLQLP